MHLSQKIVYLTYSGCMWNVCATLQYVIRKIAMMSENLLHIEHKHYYIIIQALYACISQTHILHKVH